MSLATRCPACGTVFRVVQDQLRVSEGWVRCGRCAEVFNAVDKLVDLELENPPQRAAAHSAHRDRVIDDLVRVAGQAGAPPGPWSADTAREGPAESTALPAMSGGRAGAATQRDDHFDAGHAGDANSAPRQGFVADRDADADADAGADSDSDLDDSRPAEPERERAPAPASEARAAPDLRAEPPPFVREAERAATWRTSRRRGALAGAVLLAAGVLGLQVAMTYRDLIAARWSVLRPPLALLCSWAGCRIEPPRQVDALVVDSSGLLRVGRSSNYQLSLVLRNRAPIELAVPAVDLTLTDARGELIARRVLDAAELGVSQRGVPGGAELSMKGLLAVGDRPVSGYTIEVFYP